MTNNNPTDGPGSSRPRRHLRLAAIGGIAAVAILGGGITAVASASAPARSTSAAAAPTSGATPPSGGPAAPGTDARPTPRPHLDGTVTSVSGGTVSIKDRDGFTRTILVTSKTTYSDGLKAPLAVGTEVHAEGTVDANRTALDASSVGKRPTPPAGGPGRSPGWGGPGGPGHDGRGGPPPAGARGGGGMGATPPTGTAAPSTSTAAPTTS